MGNLTNPATPIAQFTDSAVPLEPTELRQGDSWNWERMFANFPSGLYKLTYILNSATSRFVFPDAAITADSDGQGFNIQAAATQTAACVPGTYQIAAVLSGIAGTTAEGQQVTLPLQDVIVSPNLAGATGPVDTRSFVKKRLDMIEAAISGDARPDVQEYMINGRQIRKISPIDLERLRSIYRQQYKAELRAAGLYTEPRGIGFRITPASM